MADPHYLSLPSRKVAQDLTRAADVLENMQLREAEKLAVPGSPNVPPALFGAGGPMSVSS